MKKLLALFVAGLMTLSLTACGSSTNNADKTLTVATFEMNGDFIDGFGNSAYDANIRYMIHGYETIATDSEGAFLINNTVVKEMKEDVASNGDKTFTFTINDGLTWNDGTALTAKDYVFAVLFEASNEWLQAGATSSTGDSLVGHKEYNDATAETFAGVQLVDDSTFSLTVAADQLPYFYEWSYVSILPRPLHIYAPGAEIASDANGSKITGVDLAQAAVDVAKTYRFKPLVTAGPYNFESFENGQVVLKLNETFKGDYNGEKATIGTIVQKTVNPTTDIDLLIAGEVDIVEGVVEGEKIEKAKAASNLAYSQYSRNGYGNVPIATDFGATQDPAVRRAINYIIDKDTVIQNVLGGYGSTVNGDYGKAQWMYQTNKAEIDKLPSYAFSIDNANKELDTTDYKFEADGTTPWDAAKALDSKEYYRYNSKGEVLAINHLGTENNPVTDSLETSFLANYPKVGVKFSIDRSDFATLMDNYYYGWKQGEKRKYNTFNMATSFTPVYDPYYSYYSGFIHTTNNPTGIDNADLDAAMIAMRELAPTDKEAYSAKWLEYQTIFNEILPVIPVYANTYFDFYNKSLSGVETGPMKKWSQIITTISFE